MVRPDFSTYDPYKNSESKIVPPQKIRPPIRRLGDARFELWRKRYPELDDDIIRTLLNSQLTDAELTMFFEEQIRKGETIVIDTTLQETSFEEPTLRKFPRQTGGPGILQYKPFHVNTMVFVASVLKMTDNNKHDLLMDLLQRFRVISDAFDEGDVGVLNMILLEFGLLRYILYENDELSNVQNSKNMSVIVYRKNGKQIQLYFLENMPEKPPVFFNDAVFTTNEVFKI